MSCREKLEAYLRDNGVPFQVQHHPVAFTAQKVAASEHIPGKMMAKVVMAFANGKLVMLVLPAPYHVDFAKAATALGVGAVRLAHESEFAGSFPDCQVGAQPPFGNLYGLPVYVDQDLAKDDTIVIEAGTYTDTVSLKFADYQRLVNPTIVDLARRH